MLELLDEKDVYKGRRKIVDHYAKCKDICSEDSIASTTADGGIALELVDGKYVRKGRSKIIDHHTKYKEIHGEDRIVPMEHGDHVSLHAKLRREGKCKISSKELRRISHNACARKIYIKRHPRKGNKCSDKKCYKCDEFRICLLLNDGRELFPKNCMIRKTDIKL